MQGEASNPANRHRIPERRPPSPPSHHPAAGGRGRSEGSCIATPPRTPGRAATWRRVPPASAGTLPPAAADPPEELRRVDLADLVRFLGNPARQLYAVRLHLHLEDETPVLDEREPFEVEGLEKYGLEEALVAAGLAGRDQADELPTLRARGLLPHGSAGESALGEVGEEISEFLQALRPELTGEPLGALSFERELATAAGPFVLTGRLAGLRTDRLLLHRPATVKAKDRCGSGPVTWP